MKEGKRKGQDGCPEGMRVCERKGEGRMRARGGKWRAHGRGHGESKGGRGGFNGMF